MKKDLFLQLLRRKLDFLPVEAREAALAEYARRFEGLDPEGEEALVRSLGTPAQIAEDLRRRYMEAPGPAQGAGPVFTPPAPAAQAPAPVTQPIPTAVGATAAVPQPSPHQAPVAAPVYSPPSRSYAEEPEGYGAAPAFTPSGTAHHGTRAWVLALCSPLWIALCAVLFALCMALLLVGVALLLAGLGLLIVGLAGAAMSLFNLLSPGRTLLLLGSGLLLAGLGLLIFWGGAAIVAKGFPAAASGSCGLIGRIFKGGDPK